jgi:thymidine kinase
LSDLTFLADDITILKALCFECGAEATKTYRKDKGGEQINIDDGNNYLAACKDHWTPR